jgi:hypothetical protein
MKAKVTKEFAGRPDGEALSRAVQVGEVISGDLAAVAVSEKWAEEVGAETVADNGDPLAGLTTVAQLKAYAEEKGIDLGDATKKDDIRAAIHLALEAAKA